MYNLEGQRQNDLFPGVVWITVKSILKSCTIIHVFQNIPRSNDLILKTVNQK